MCENHELDILISDIVKYGDREFLENLLADLLQDKSAEDIRAIYDRMMNS